MKIELRGIHGSEHILVDIPSQDLSGAIYVLGNDGERAVGIFNGGMRRFYNVEVYTKGIAGILEKELKKIQLEEPIERNNTKNKMGRPKDQEKLNSLTKFIGDEISFLEKEGKKLTQEIILKSLKDKGGHKNYLSYLENNNLLCYKYGKSAYSVNVRKEVERLLNKSSA